MNWKTIRHRRSGLETIILHQRLLNSLTGSQPFKWISDQGITAEMRYTTEEVEAVTRAYRFWTLHWPAGSHAWTRTCPLRWDNSRKAKGLSKPTKTVSAQRLTWSVYSAKGPWHLWIVKIFRPRSISKLVIPSRFNDDYTGLYHLRYPWIKRFLSTKWSLNNSISRKHAV